MNILFIDDDPEDVELFCEVIQEIVPTAVCNSLSECNDLECELERIGTQDIIFLDGHMSPVSGKQCLIKLKQVTDPGKTKIIIHTGSISQKEEAEFLGMGVTAVLYKAADISTIRANLTNAILGESKQSA